MKSFSLAFEVISPLFVWMAIGYACRSLLNLNDEWIRKTNDVMFRIFLSALLFKNMAESNLSLLDMGMFRLVGFVFSVLLLLIGALVLIVPRLEKESSRRGTVIQGIYRSNTALFGIPVAVSIYGAQNTAPVSLMLACGVVMFNIVAVLVLEHYRSQGKRTKPVDLLKRICTNPLILGIAAGLLVNLLHIPLPTFLKAAVWGMADCATPVSFFLLGASFSFASAAHNFKTLTGVVLTKLVLSPLIAIGAAILLGFQGQQLLAVLIIFAPPTAVSSYPMACAMGGDGELASEIVVFTSLFSVLTMFLWLFGLNYFSLL